MWPQRACTIADLRIGEEGHGALQEIGRRDEVGVEDRDELALGDLQPASSAPGLVAGAIGAMDDR